MAPLTNAWAPSTSALTIKTVNIPSTTIKICSRYSRSILNMSTEVDEVYYSPASFTDRLGSSQEMEDQAASMKYGMGGGSSGQKITLTRWLSAKVQDFPEVSNS